MQRQELIDTLRVFLEQQVYGKGLIPAKNAVIKNNNIGWLSFKLQFGDDKFQIMTSHNWEYSYEDVLGITYSSVNETATIMIYLKNDIPLQIKTPVKTKWYHFSNESSIMKFRWGDYEVGKFMYCKGEFATDDSPLLVFTRKPFDFNLDGKLIVLNEDERWMGYILEGENAEVKGSEVKRPTISRKLEIEGFIKKTAVVKEIIDYYFENNKHWYRYTGYYTVDFTNY